MRAVRLAIVLLSAAALLPIEADAGGKSGGGRSHSSSGGGKHHSHHHHHHGGGVSVYYGYPYYYYPTYYDPYGVPLYPPVPADPYWYYCRAANAYYPYVNSCPGGWERYLPGNPS